MPSGEQDLNSARPEENFRLLLPRHLRQRHVDGLSLGILDAIAPIAFAVLYEFNRPSRIILLGFLRSLCVDRQRGDRYEADGNSERAKIHGSAPEALGRRLDRNAFARIDKREFD